MYFDMYEYNIVENFVEKKVQVFKTIMLKVVVL